MSVSNLELLIATLLQRVNYGLVQEDVGLEKDAKMPAVSLPGFDRSRRRPSALTRCPSIRSGTGHLEVGGQKSSHVSPKRVIECARGEVQRARTGRSMLAS